VPAGTRGAKGDLIDREAGSDAVALRLRDGRRLDGVSVDRLIPQLVDLVASRSADLGFR
jgi:hypothetical protein